MTDKEIFNKAVEQAKKNGMDEFTCHPSAFGGVWIDKKGYILSWHGVLFSHEFCKAFFGTERIKHHKAGGTVEYHTVAWQFHLQIMVLEENPISYLAKFL